MRIRLGFYAAMFVSTCAAEGAWWIGPGSSSGPVVRPQAYLDTVAPLVSEMYCFDDLSPATVVTNSDLGDFSLATAPPTANVVAEVSPVAGALASSEPMALLVEEVATAPTTLTFLMNEPVISVGFALLGARSAMRLRILGEEGDVLADNVIPSGPADARRWIGMSQDDRDIFAVRIEPLLTGDYGIDDVEIGIRTPEPPACICFLFMAALVFPARRVIVSPP